MTGKYWDAPDGNPTRPAHLIAWSNTMGMEQIPFTALYRNPQQVTIDRAWLESIIANAIELLDHFDGDPDIEPNGDEEDHNNTEECFVRHRTDGKPGCPISDPGGCEHDGREEEHE